MSAPKEIELEVWENPGLNTVGIRKHDAHGNLIHEMIQGRRKVHLTPLERRINQEISADDTLDPFKNGMLRPVRLIDSDEFADENKAIQANPNAMSETAMKALFKSQPTTFKKKVDEIVNPVALEHLLEVASDVDASIRQVEAIKTRLDSVRPDVEKGGARIMGTSAIGSEAPRGEQRMPKGVTPK